MKKLLCLLLATLMLVSFVGCENDKQSETEESDEIASTAITTSEVIATTSAEQDITETTTAKETAETPKHTYKLGVGTFVTSQTIPSEDFKEYGNLINDECSDEVKEAFNTEPVITVYAAAVLLDEQDRVVKCDIDSLDFGGTYLNIQKNFLLPKIITKDRFESEILGKFNKDDPYENWALKKILAFYSFNDPTNNQLSNTVIAQMHEDYPITKDGTAIYALVPDIVRREYMMLHSYLTDYVPDYTVEDLIYDYELVGYDYSDTWLLDYSTEPPLIVDSYNQWSQNDVIAAYLEKNNIGRTAQTLYCPNIAKDTFVPAILAAIENAKATDVSIDNRLNVTIAATCFRTPNIANGNFDLTIDIAAVGTCNTAVNTTVLSGVPFVDEPFKTVDTKEWLDAINKFNTAVSNNNVIEEEHPKCLFHAYRGW